MLVVFIATRRKEILTAVLINSMISSRVEWVRCFYLDKSSSPPCVFYLYIPAVFISEYPLGSTTFSLNKNNNQEKFINTAATCFRSRKFKVFLRRNFPPKNSTVFLVLFVGFVVRHRGPVSGKFRREYISVAGITVIYCKTP